ncbi:MAG: hypothetical protein F6K28_13285 [Microcoleus sp. SIO2G3]|nr:hypothetical protein [Microcoleus sp. SIO2G3]
MIAKSTHYAVCLGLAGGLAVAIAPAVRAEIQVTGGSAGGQAAFFVPVPGGSGTGVELFDVGINQLRLETPNGNTSTAIFTPTAASFDAGADNQPNAGDTGTLQGGLAGIAFSANGGTPTPFLNRDTVLNFTLTSFQSNLGVVDGTLISPQTAGDAPLVFLPAVEATVANGSSFQATLGELQLGDFEADINDGVIDLASNLQFRESGSTSTSTTSSVNLQRRIKFTFEGEDVTPEDGTDFNVGNNGNDIDDDNDFGDDDDDNDFGDDDDDIDDDNDFGDDDDDSGSIRFVGEVNKKLEIQSVGTQAEREFKIEADLAAVDIAINGPFNIQTDDGLNENDIIDKYKIEGESEGIISEYANAFGFSGTARRDTQFTFEQGTNKLEGRSSGDVDFYAAAGVTSINRDIEFTNIQDGDFNSGSNGGSNGGSSGSGGSSEFSFCNICGVTLVRNSSIVIGGTDVTVGSPIIVVTNSGNAGSGSGNAGSGSGSSSNTNPTFANSVNVNVFSLATAFTSSTARAQYQILASGNIRIVTDIDADFGNGNDVATGNDDEERRTRVRLVQRGGRRYYVVVREGSSGENDDDQQTATDNEQDDDQQTATDNEQDDDQQTATDNEQDDDQQTATDNEQDDDQQTATDNEQDDDQQTATDNEQDDDQQTATDNEQDDDQQTATDNEQDDDQQTATDNEQDDDDQQTATDNEQETDGETVAAYELVGPSSRCFHGLVGLQQIPDSEVNTIEQ